MQINQAAGLAVFPHLQLLAGLRRVVWPRSYNPPNVECTGHSREATKSREATERCIA